MATILTNVTDDITLAPGASWNFWFYANGGQWQPAPAIDQDRSVVHAIARPWLPDSWDIEGDESTVLLQEDATATPLRYRHVYVLNVKNHSTSEKRAFFIAATELRP